MKGLWFEIVVFAYTYVAAIIFDIIREDSNKRIENWFTEFVASLIWPVTIIILLIYTGIENIINIWEEHH